MDGKQSASSSPSTPAPASSTKSNSPIRIYIGNLPPTLTEYALMKLFSPFGNLTNIDFLWHKGGPKKGQPRGYCFIDYAEKEHALRAIEEMSGKVVGGRQLVVNFTTEENEKVNGSSGKNVKTTTSAKKKSRVDPRFRETQESVNPRLQARVVNASTDSKISALERKLAQLQGQIRIGGENIVKMGGGGSRVDGSGSNGSTNTSVASPRFKPYSK